MPTAMTARVINHIHGRPTVQLIPMANVNQARLEFGATPSDARMFVQDTCCLECGYAAIEARECWSCGTQGCACQVMEQDHSDEYACRDCIQPCYGRCCNDDYDA